MKKILILITILTCNSILGQIPNYIPTNSLVSWWPFNGNANDESNNGNNGIVYGATLSSDRFSNQNSAYSFDGLDDDIRINLESISNTFPIGVSCTWSVWIKTNEQYAPIISLESGNSNIAEFNLNIGYLGTYFSTSGLILLESAGDIGLSVSDVISNSTEVPDYIFASSISNDNWHNVTVTRDMSLSSSGILSIYIDGILSAQSSSSQYSALSLGGGYMSFGSNQFWVQYGNTPPLGPTQDQKYFEGFLDDIAIWNRVLTTQEILDIATSSYSGLIEPSVEIEISPNPTSDYVNITSTTFHNENFTLLDPQGRKVLSGTLTGTTTQLDLSKIARGNYLLQIGEKLTPVKLVKE